ncbi:MAG: METTL5 family protein [Acidilobaceae archaeon]
MKIQSLAAILEKAAPPIPEPLRDLEQYTTPSELALSIAQHAKLSGLLDDAIVVDLGAGTCRLALAALMLGAPKAVAVEADHRLAELCVGAAETLGLEGRLQFVTSMVLRDEGPLAPGYNYLVLSNPPFGVWRRGADTEVILYGLRLKPLRMYAILKASTLDYHRGLALKEGYSVEVLWRRLFPIPASMEHHESRIRRVEVNIVCFRKA